jgi:hypothetical protein
LRVLKEAENAINLKDVIISNLPELRSFLSTRTVTEAALTALTKISMNTGHKSSLYAEFDKILSDKNKSKKFSLLKERRFCLLGYTAAAILHHLEDFKELLISTKSKNLLVLACRVYIENDFVLKCISALAYFTFTVTFPYFNLCEKALQADFKHIMPQLYNDLTCKKTDTLANYVVNYSFVVKPVGDVIGEIIIDQFCMQASKDLQLQKGREYGFSSDRGKQRATNLAALSENEIEGLPTNNMICERHFGRLDHLLKRSGQSVNRNFKGYGKLLNSII